MQAGDSYNTGLDNEVSCLKRTGSAIHLSNGLVIRKKTLSDGSFYLDSKSRRIGNRNYPAINQVIRDIEGFLVYKIHAA